MSILAAKAALTTIKGFLPTTPQQIVTMVAVAGLCLSVGFCKGDDYRNAKWKAQTTLATVKDQAGTIAANEAAGGDRVADALRIERNEKELIDAISEIPDTAPDPVRVALGCKRLLNSGTRPADLPAVCRRESDNSSQANPAR